MSEVRQGLHYTQNHYWVEIEDEETVRVGLTDFGQAQLGDVTQVNLPSEGDAVEGDTAIGDIEASDNSSELLSPLSGSVVEVNGDLEDSPALVNDDPYGDGWLFVITISDPAELDDLLTDSEYEEFLQTEMEDEDY